MGPFLSTLAVWIYGNGVLPLLPLYAIERGASETTSGLFLAFAFLCLALGTFTTGLLPRDFRNRKWLIVTSGLLMVGLTSLTSHITTVLQFAGATGLTWFLGGVVFSQAATLTGLAADSADRGMAFGIIGTTNGLGSLIGGIGLGYVADHFGFAGVFESSAAVCILIVGGGLLSVESPVVLPAASGGGERNQKTTIVTVLVFLFAAQMLLAFTNATGNLGRSLAMNSRGFSKFTIDMTASIQGLVALCLPLLLGWLSDKIGRRWIMITTYLLVSASLVVLAFSRTAWHFYFFAGLYAFLTIPPSVGPAYVMDIVPRDRAARSVSLFQAAFWVGSIAGMSASGIAFEKLGTFRPILLSSLFPIAGIVLLLLIRERARPGSSHPRPLLSYPRP